MAQIGLLNAICEVPAGGSAGTLCLLGSRPGSRSPVCTARLHTSCFILDLNEGGKSFVKGGKETGHWALVLPLRVFSKKDQ